LKEKKISLNKQLPQRERDFLDFLRKKRTKLPSRKRDLECPELLRRKCRRWTLLKLEFFHTIGEVSKCSYWKWACIFHLKLWTQSYGKKKSKKLNWLFDSSPLKPKKQGSKLPFIEICNILLERSHKRLYLCNWKLFNERSYKKVLNPQSYED
jgi:hypothetical protein